MTVERDRLAAELMRTQQALAQQKGAEEARIDYWDKQASIANGCDFLLPVCPDRFIAVGHKALSAGFGGNGPWAWIAFIMKVLVSASLIMVLRLQYLRWCEPAQQKVKEARQLIDCSCSRAHEARMAGYRAEERLAEMQLQLKDEQVELDRLLAECEMARAELNALRASIGEGESALATLNSLSDGLRQI